MCWILKILIVWSRYPLWAQWALISVIPLLDDDYGISNKDWINQQINKIENIFNTKGLSSGHWFCHGLTFLKGYLTIRRQSIPRGQTVEISNCAHNTCIRGVTIQDEEDNYWGGGARNTLIRLGLENINY